MQFAAVDRKGKPLGQVCDYHCGHHEEETHLSRDQQRNASILFHDRAKTMYYRIFVFFFRFFLFECVCVCVCVWHSIEASTLAL